jgi:hypothetical protein
MCRYFVVAGVIVDVCSALRLYLSAVNAKPTDADPPFSTSSRRRASSSQPSARFATG